MQSKKSGFIASVSFGLLAALLTGFAPPASAWGSDDDDYPKKTISLSVTPTTLSTATTAVSATITNTGNSNANSFEVDWATTLGFTVTGASVGGVPGTCSTAGRTSGYSGCVFLKQMPVKTSVTITLNVQVANQCNAMSINWLAYAWTGSPGSVSQSFKLKPPAPVVTSSSPNCSIKFVAQPQDAFIGSTITSTTLNSAPDAPRVSVQLLQNGAPSAAGKAVSLSASPVSCATPVGSATTDASGVAVLNATAAAAGPCVLTAFAPGYGSASSQTFNGVAPVGRLGCDTGNNTFGTTGANSLVQNGTRLGNVSDPLAPPIPGCVVVPYIVSGTCPVGVTGAACTNFTYDPLNQGTNMAFVFRWEWPLEAIPPGGIGAIQNTGQLFINGNPTPLNLDLCREIVPAFALDGTFTGLATGSPPPADQETSVPGTQAGCLVRRVVKQVGNQIQLIEDAYVQGDYTARRN